MSLLEIILKNGYQISKDALSVLKNINQTDDFLVYLKANYPNLLVIELIHIKEYQNSTKEKFGDNFEVVTEAEAKKHSEKVIDSESKIEDKKETKIIKHDIDEPIDWSFKEINIFSSKEQKIDSVDDFTKHYNSRCTLLSNLASNCLERRRKTEFSFKDGKIPLGGKITVSGIVTKKTKIKLGFEVILENQYNKIIRVVVKDKKLLKDLQRLPKNVVISFSGEVFTDPDPDPDPDPDNKTAEKNDDIINLNAKSIHFPDCFVISHKQKDISKSNQSSSSDKDPYLLIVGDIHFGNSKMELERYNNFLTYLIEGKTAFTGDKHHDIYNNIQGVIFLGDIVDINAIGHERNNFEYSKIYQDFFEKFDQIPDSIKMVVIPGEKDYADYFIPQRPLKNYSAKITFCPNPSYLKFAYRKILVYHDYSQKNLPDFLSLKDINKLYQWKLRYNHLSPKWNDQKSYYYPYYPDPLVITEIPDIFAIGHHQVASYEFFNNTLIVTGGTFKRSENLINRQSLGIIPAINLKTLKTTMLSF